MSVRTNGNHASDPLIGQVLDGRYVIESVLGEGAMGIVYRAVHDSIDKPVAIKVLRREISRNEQIVARFKQEAQMASRIGNEHIVDISDFGELADGSTYFAMELLHGRPLSQALREEAFDIARTVHIGRQLCNALAAAHAADIVHRDLKPENIQLVARGDDPDFVKLLDFGIAKVVGASRVLTQVGQVFGTPHYMSPEQCSGADVDHRTDIYSVGVILYELVTGRLPFEAPHVMGILQKQLYEAPRPPRAYAPHMPRALEETILRCLAKQPEHRFPSVRQLEFALIAVSDSLGSAIPDRYEHPSGLRLRESSPSELEVEPIRATRKRRSWGLWLVAAACLFGALRLFEVVGPATWPPQADDSPASVVTPAPAKAARAPGDGTSEGKTSPSIAIETPSPQTAATPQLVADPSVGAEPSEPEPAQPLAEPVEAPAQPPSLQITSVPAGAMLYVDGHQVGPTPVLVPQPAQAQELTLRLAGYKDAQIELPAPGAESMQVDLERVKPAARPVARKPRTTPADTAPRERLPPAPDPPPVPPAVESEVLDPWG